MRTHDQDYVKTATWAARVAHDIGEGRVISCKTTTPVVGGRQGHATVRGKNGPRVKPTFILYSSRRVSVTSANATNYFSQKLCWSSSGDHGRSADISRDFGAQLNAAADRLKLSEVAKMPRLLRWWYLRRN